MVFLQQIDGTICPSEIDATAPRSEGSAEVQHTGYKLEHPGAKNARQNLKRKGLKMKRLILTLACALLAAQFAPLSAQPRVDRAFTAQADSGHPYATPRPRRANPVIPIRRWADSDGYHLQIFTGSDDPQAIDVRLSGRSLLLSSARSFQTDRQDSQGVRRFEHRFSRFSRRLPVPRDADTANMRTREQDGVMTITFPRLSSGWNGLREHQPGSFNVPRYR